MRTAPPLIACLIAVALLPAAAYAQDSPASLLAQAKAKFAAEDTVGADALLQQVIDHPDASIDLVEEALFWQIKLYYGDVVGAALLLGPLSGTGIDQSKLTQDVARQMLLARRAFQLAGTRYLNTTAIGSGLRSIKVDLPSLTDANVNQLKATIGDKAQVESILTGYSTDPKPGLGLVSMANRFGLYIGMGSELPGKPQGEVGSISAQFSNGVAFDEPRFLDWLAEVSLELHGIVNEPNGPDLKGLSKRADDRLVQKAAGDSNYAKNAKRRAGQR
jgi:hypothetical protein